MGRARLVLWERNTRLGQGRQRRLSHRLPLLFVVRRIGDVTGQDDLTGRVHTDLRVAAVLPAFVIGLHDVQFRVGEVALRIIRRGIFHRLGHFASAFLACPLALRLRLGAALTLGVRFRLGPRLQPSHGRLNRGQAVLAARQLGGQFIASTASQGCLLCLVLLVGLGHQDLNVLRCLLHISVAHRLVTRRIALDFCAIGRHVAQLHQPRFSCQTYHRDKHVDECFQMQLTEVADRAEVRTVLAHNGHESQVAFAGQRNLAAGKHPHTIRIQQQADHHRRIERWGTARFVLVGGIEAA